MSKRPTQSKQSSRRRKPPVPVRAVDFIMYCARDMRRTRKFYQELFGLKRGGEWNDFWSEFKTSPVTLCLNGPARGLIGIGRGPLPLRSPFQTFTELSKPAAAAK